MEILAVNELPASSQTSCLSSVYDGKVEQAFLLISSGSFMGVGQAFLPTRR